MYRADAPFMLKLSLGARITNSVRVNLAKELARGVEVHRLLAAGLGAELAGRFPGFAIVRDPAWLTLRTGRDGPESGFEVVLRENPYREGDRTDASVVAGLCHPGPGGGPSRLATLVRDLAASSGRPTGAVAAEWFRRYKPTDKKLIIEVEEGGRVALADGEGRRGHRHGRSARSLPVQPEEPPAEQVRRGRQGGPREPPGAPARACARPCRGGA